MLRYSGICIVITLIAVLVLAKAFYIMTVQRSYWMAVNSSMKFDSLVVSPVRGNILSANGQQMACNLPEYRMYMDFQTLKEGKTDSLWHDGKTLNAICKGLHRIFPEQSAAQFKAHLEEGYAKDSRYWAIVKKRVNYTTYQAVKTLPIFKLKPGKGGFTAQKFMVRNRPYGSLACSVIGDTYKEKGVAYSGLELAFDDVLKGKSGFKHRRKVLNGWVDMLDSAAVDGEDIVTTIDVGMQDLAERALIKELKKDNAYTGVAIVMEVATGDIKAMVNMDKVPDSNPVEYKEQRNHAIADLLEPGSVFKTASILVALDDGFIPDTANCWVDTGGGVKLMGGREMKDHNWHRGGYGTINVSRILQVSSNVGVSELMLRFYGKNPDKFVKGIHRIGLATNLKLPFPEYSAPRIRIPVRDKKGHFTSSILTLPSGRQVTKNWSATALPWMSIGYETQVPPISTLTLYNAIANNGCMVKPRFVTRVEKNGKTVKEFPVEVIKKQICSSYALGTMQDILYKVVSVGLGKTAGSPLFGVSGKTGTAQKAHNGSYKNGGMDYLLSFCGYFPSGKDNNGKKQTPKYSCIVCIQKAGLPASGGKMSGQVFHDIAEGIMAQRVKYSATQSGDAHSVYVPDVKPGNKSAAHSVLSHLGIKRQRIVHRSAAVAKTKMPDVTGMGARDAVFLIESRGAKVILHGRGKVLRQSKPFGSTIHKGEKIQLDLEP